MTSVVIAAHNEAGVIGRCLDALRPPAAAAELEIVVVANGCTDETATVARQRRGVIVAEIPVASKVEALNTADRLTSEFPRIYLDADIVVSIDDVRALAAAVTGPVGERVNHKILAAVPRRTVDVRSSPTLVRSYFAINTRLPAFRTGLFGRGAIALSEEGRARFDQFPNLLADDLFLDSLFDSEEKVVVASVSTVVSAPRTTRDLMRRLVRVRSGNSAMRLAAAHGGVATVVRSGDRMSWLRDVVVNNPRLAPAGLVYAAISSVAALLAKRPSAAGRWGRDESTRRSP